MGETARPDQGWAGRLLFGPWWLVYVGRVGPTERHRHHAIQIVFAAGTRVVDPDGEWPSPMLVLPDRPHAIAGAGTGTVVFVDPHATRAAGLPALQPSPHPLEAGPPATIAEAEQLVWSLTEQDQLLTPVPHPAVRAALATLPDDPDIPLSTLARHVGLSASRLSHLFRDEVGIPLRAYRPWVRMLLAADALRGGASLTEAAHRSGFADVSHLHRTFRDQFGLSPGRLLRAVEWVTG